MHSRADTAATAPASMCPLLADTALLLPELACGCLTGVVVAAGAVVAAGVVVGLGVLPEGVTPGRPGGGNVSVVVASHAV